mgnify:CR=1 FL=1
MADIGRWGVTDPLAEKYYSISPYTFVANNPILFVDPDGQEIWITYGDNQRVKYENGRLYNEDGSKYKGKDEFVSSAYKTLNGMNSTRNGKSVLGELSASENKFTFTNTYEKDSEGNDAKGTLSFAENKDGGGEIHAAALMNKETGLGEKIENTAHELYHGYQHENGQGGPSVNNEVEAYLFGRSIALQSHNASNFSFGNMSIMGKEYESAMLNLLTNAKFDRKSFQNAVMAFKTGSTANTSGIYNGHAYRRKRPLISRFYPLID